MWNRNLHNCIRISILVLLRIEIFVIGKHVNHGGEYRLEIYTIFHFYGPKKAIKPTKNKKIKIEENLNEIVKHCPK